MAALLRLDCNDMSRYFLGLCVLFPYFDCIHSDVSVKIAEQKKYTHTYMYFSLYSISTSSIPAISCPFSVNELIGFMKKIYFYVKYQLHGLIINECNSAILGWIVLSINI